MRSSNQAAAAAFGPTLFSGMENKVNPFALLGFFFSASHFRCFYRNEMGLPSLLVSLKVLFPALHCIVYVRTIMCVQTSRDGIRLKALQSAA